MSLSLREQLHISSAASMEETSRICSEYYTIYKTIYETSRDPLVRKIAQERIHALEEAAAAESVTLSYLPADPSATVKDIPTQISLFLSERQSPISKSEYDRQAAVLSNMPDCAEKHYLEACLLLAMGPLDDKRAAEVAKYIASAVRKDGDNPVYKTIVKDINAKIEKYNLDLQNWKNEKQRIEDKKLVDDEHRRRWEKVKVVLKHVGKALLWVGAAIGTVVGVVFSCICESCDGC